MSTIPITSLTAATDPPSDKAIRGVVTLFWPYSSSTRQCAFLLADHDFRLRNKRGQVRVRFTGPSAEAVAKSRVGIGDEVVLSLGGSSWEEDPEATRTPGKSVDGELFFRRKLQLAVTKDGGDVQVNVDAPASSPRAVEHDASESLATPLPRAVVNLRASQGRGAEELSEYAYSSPAFVKRLKLSGESYLDSAFDPFVGEAMDVDYEDEQRGTSFGRAMKWRYAAKTPSPTMETSNVLDRVEQDISGRLPLLATDATSVHDNTAEKMPPPPRPQLQLPSPSLPAEASAVEDDQDGPLTPKLLPVKSPTLPLPSPFPTDTFSQPHFDLSFAREDRQTQNKQASDLVAPRHDDGSTPTLSQVDQVQGDPLDRTEMSPPRPRRSVTQPETPTKASLTTRIGFGLDGATATTTQEQKVSPQDAEKSRVMAQTFRSLFGFTGSSRPIDEIQRSSAQAMSTLSELEQQRLDAAKQTSAKFHAPDAPSESFTMVGIKETSTTSAEAALTEPETMPQPRTQTEPEVIEIDSSSEDDESMVKEKVPSEQLTSTAQEIRSRFKSPEIPDTYQDSQVEDLMASQGEITLRDQTMLSQNTTSALQRQHTDDSLLESFIESDHLYPTLPAVEAQVQGVREPEVKATSPEAQVSPRAESGTQQATMTEQSLQQPSYPSLPLSPSNSQSIQDMASQDALRVSDTMASLLPLTPQLTQVGSSATQLQEMLSTQAAALQDDIQQDMAKSQDHAAGNQSMPPMVQPETVRLAEKTIVQELIPSERHHEEPTLPPSEEAVTGRITRSKAKKAAAGRISNIPDAISSYFSPKRSSAAAVKEKVAEPSMTVEATTNGHVVTETKDLQPVNGLATSLSYFTPLSRLDALLNPSLSQQAFGSTNTVDVFAVVTKSTREPVRAKKGPRDHYTIFRITDSSLSPSPSVRVEIFRPYKNTLPTAKEGDVILLRAFTVKSRERQSYLVSNDASAWCVFTSAEQPSKTKPAWALKAGEENKAFSENMTGPPVEFGQEERGHAQNLRKWWATVRLEQRMKHDGIDHDDDDDDDDNDANGINGHITQPMAARL